MIDFSKDDKRWAAAREIQRKLAVLVFEEGRPDEGPDGGSYRSPGGGWVMRSKYDEDPRDGALFWDPAWFMLETGEAMRLVDKMLERGYTVEMYASMVGYECTFSGPEGPDGVCPVGTDMHQSLCIAICLAALDIFGERGEDKW
jgi:hypothetical protein